MVLLQNDRPLVMIPVERVLTIFQRSRFETIDLQDFQARLSNDLVELSHLRKVTRKTGHPLPPLPGAIVLESSLTRQQEVVRLRNKELAEKLAAAKPSPISCTSTPLPGTPRTDIGCEPLLISQATLVVHFKMQLLCLIH